MNEAEKFEYEVSKKCKDDTVMMLTPFTNMESQLSAAPLCLSIMSHINILSTSKNIILNHILYFITINLYSEKDFSLLTEDDEKGTQWMEKYKLLSEPRSFRASLEQVNSEAFEAFRLSHKNMGAIQIMTGRIPGYENNLLVVSVL